MQRNNMWSIVGSMQTPPLLRIIIMGIAIGEKMIQEKCKLKTYGELIHEHLDRVHI